MTQKRKRLSGPEKIASGVRVLPSLRSAAERMWQLASPGIEKAASRSTGIPAATIGACSTVGLKKRKSGSASM